MEEKRESGRNTHCSTVDLKKGAEYLRLFVVDINQPAIKLYMKNGFKRANGIYDEQIDEEIVLHEFGFEIKTSMRSNDLTETFSRKVCS